MSAAPPLLVVEGLRKAFATVLAVDEVTFSLAPGEILALLGPNGAGKTTTVRMITGILRPDAGHMTFRGRDGAILPQVPAHELGYLPEERGLYLDQTVLRQLVYFGQLRGLNRDEADRAAREGLERVGLSDRAREKVSALSKGNQQKVQLLAALLHQPRLAILDEPFSGFDPVNQELALDWIRELRASGTTILLSAHQMPLVERLADRILLMRQGRMVRFGTVDALRAQEHPGCRMEVAFTEAFDADGLVVFPGVSGIERLGNDRVALLLSPEVDLNALLAVLARGPRVRLLTTEALDLHELYLRAVAADGTGADAQEAPCVR